jgi:type VI secretion system secreted protein Hcp
MAADNFLKFVDAAVGSNLSSGGVGATQPVGESQDVAHEKWLEVKTFEFGAENPTTIGSATSGAGAGKFKLNPFKITKDVDTSSTSLFQACAAGAHFPTVCLSLRKAGGAQNDYLTFCFRMVFVTNISWSGGGGEEAPEETVEFVYGGLGVKYLPQKSTGAMGVKRGAEWNQITNKPNLTVPGLTGAAVVPGPSGKPNYYP